MKGLIQRLAERQQQKSEQRAIEVRNAERRALCVEYANNTARRAAIIARLAELSGEANLQAAAARLADELDGIPRPRQAMMVAPTYTSGPDRWAHPSGPICHDPVRAQFDAEAA